MTAIIGKVLDKAGTDSFYFVSDEYYDSAFVEVRADYIQDGARIIGEVIERETLNPYFEKAVDLRYVDLKDETVSMRSLFVSKVKSIALIDKENRGDVIFPPLPGTNVAKAHASDIRLALGLSDSGLDIGTLPTSTDVVVRVPPNRLLRTHIAILGQTGSGKSYLGAKIAIELLKFRSGADVPSTVAVPVIFDSSGEYTGSYDIGAQNQIGLIIPTIVGKDHYFPLLNEKYLSLLYEIYEVDEREESELRHWLGSLSDTHIKEDKQGTLEGQSKKGRELIEQFGQQKVSSTKQLANGLEDLIRTLNALPGIGPFPAPLKALSKMRRLNLRIRRTAETDLVQGLSRGAIINLSEYDNYSERQVAVLLFLRQIYEIAKSNKSAPRMLVFIDEAHNYVPSVYKSACKDEILRLAREGRKYGITLCLISQRPRWVDPTALSQCGNVFVFRIQNSDDKKHILDSASLPDSLRDANIARFRTGEMIVTGDVVGHALRCYVTGIDQDFVDSQRKRSATGFRREMERLLERKDSSDSRTGSTE